MTLSMKLRWKAPDSSTDVNLRLKDVAAKGFLPFEPGSTTLLGAEITPVPFVLQVTVSPFVLSNFDGAVVLSDATSAPLTVADAQINYVVCRARYRLMDSPILALQVMTQAAYLADPELDWLHVVGVVDLSVGGPYATVPTSRIFYEARHAVDQQTRSSWREPVATSGFLPIPPADHNRHGDVRLVTTTGSFYWWNDTAGIWEVFDEVPVITHRDYEHTNGITGDSAAGTLLPGVSGAGALQAMDIGAVAVGSAYTVNGRLLQTPAALTSILASTVGASRGLIRVQIDDLGVISASYRAFSGTSNVDYARIVNMSDAHPAGLFTLDFTFIGSFLAWDNGPPVNVVVAPSGSRRHRLYRPNGVDWIEIVVLTAPAAPGFNTNDIYTVNAPTDFETDFLVAYWYWDGSGLTPLIVGQDKRRFGNLSFPQMGTEFKDVQFYPPETELRSNMVYSGGACSSLGGFSLRITGPIVSYIQGKRFETAGFYNGTVFPASTTRYVYVDDQGVLQIQAQDPATVFDANGRAIQVAEVARIVTDGATFTTIEDRRDPHLIIGNATRTSRLHFTGGSALFAGAELSWTEALRTFRFDNLGTPSATTVQAGAVVALSRFEGGNPLLLEDANTAVTGTVTLNNASNILTGAGTLFLTELPVGTRIRVRGLGPTNEDATYVVATVTSNTAATLTTNYGGVSGGGKTLTRPQALTSAVDDNISALQPLKLTPSIIGAVRDVQLAKKFSLGVETGCAPSIAAFPNIQIAVGTFYDALGRRIEITTPIDVNVTGTTPDDVFAIAWDPDLNSGQGGFTFDRLDNGGGCDIQDLPFAVAQVNATGASFSFIADIRRFADGQYDRSYVTVSSAQGFQEGNFLSLRQALLHVKCFGASEPMPKEIRILSGYTEPYSADDGGCIKILPNVTAGAYNLWTQATRLSGTRVVGASSSGTTIGRPSINLSQAGANDSFFLDMQGSSSNLIRTFSFENLDFSYSTGTPDSTNHGRCIFRNVGWGFAVKDCTFSGSFVASHLFAWSLSAVTLSGDTAPSNGDRAGLLIQRCYFNSLGVNLNVPFYFGDGTGTNTGTVTDINGTILIDDGTFEGAAGFEPAALIHTAAETTCDTAQLVIGLRNSRLSFCDLMFNNCTSAHKVVTGSEIQSFGALAASAGATPHRRPTFIGCQFTGASIGLDGAGEVLGCSLGENTALTLYTGNKLSSCDFTLGTVTGTFESIVNSRINILPSGAGLAAAAYASTNQYSLISDSVLLKDNANAQSNAMVTLGVANARAVLTNVRFSYVTAAITNSAAAVTLTGSAAKLKMSGCEIETVGLRDNMLYAVTSTSSGDFRLDLTDCSLTTTLGLVQVARVAGATTGEVSLSGNRFISAGVTVLDIQNSTSGQIETIKISNNTFTLSGTNPLINVFHGKFTSVAGNIFSYTDGDGAFSFGGPTTTDGRQESLLINGNVFVGRTSAGLLDVGLSSFKHITFSNNQMNVENSPAANAGCALNVLGQSFGLSCLVSGNSLNCDTAGGVGTNADSGINITKFSSIVIADNDQFVDSDGGIASVYIFADNGSPASGNQLTVTGNTAVSSSSGTGDATVFYKIFGATGGLGEIVVGNNAMEARSTGNVGCTLWALTAIACTITGNSLRSAGGTTSDCLITVTDGTYTTIGDNSLRSSITASIVADNTNIYATATGNLVYANAGDATIDLEPTTSASAIGNIVVAANGNATIQAGDLTSTSTSAVANGNVCNCTGGATLSLVMAMSVASSACTGNTLTASNDATAAAGVSRAGTGGAASVATNAIFCTSGTGLLYINSSLGGDHITSIKDNVINAPTATALIGGGLRGSIQCNTSTGALGVTNLSATDYVGGNNVSF